MDRFIFLCKQYMGLFVPAESKYILRDYVYFIELGVKGALNEKIKPEVRLKKFDLLYRQIFKKCKLKNGVLARLQQAFVKENISLSLLSDMVNFFKCLSEQTPNDTWNKKIYCNQMFISPFSRMIILLNNLNVSVYMPFASLVMCTVLISEVQSKNIKHRRFYLSKIKGFLKDAKVLPLVIKNNMFRFKIWYLLKAHEIIIKKYQNKKELKLSFVDLVKILLYAVFKWTFTKVKTLNV